MRLSSDAPEILYQEWVPAGLLVRGLVYGLAVAAAVAFLAVLLAARAGNAATLAVLAALEILLLTAFLNYRGVRILVTRDAFEARYGLLNRTRISLDRVKECRPERASFLRYWGIGVRFGTDGSFAYTTHFGPAVRIQRSPGRPFVVSSRAPQELCAAVQEALRLRGAWPGSGAAPVP